MEVDLKIPLYAKIALIFISLFGIVFILQAGQDIIVPILFGTIFAILLNPFVNFLVRKNVNRLFAISIAVILPVLFFAAVLLLVSTQTERLTESYPFLHYKFILMISDFLHWVSIKLNVGQSNITTWLTVKSTNVIDNIAYGKLLNHAGYLSLVALLLPVYVFLILYYKILLLEFVNRLFKVENQIEVAEVLVSIKTIIQSYLVGLSFEVLIMAVLNSVGLLLLGIDYAILLGVLGAFFNLIPYVGGVVGALLPMAIALVTKDSYVYPVLVMGLYIVLQLIDNNLIVPNVVARQVQINALISIIAVLIGGALWGLSGIFLSIPLIAIIKVICDHVEPLKPWGFLLGTNVPVSSKFLFLKKGLVPATGP